MSGTLSFTARSAPGFRYWAMALGALAAIGCANWAFSMLLRDDVQRVLSPILALASVPFFVLVVMRGALGRAVRLDVEPDRVVVDGGRGGVFLLSGAALGAWRMPVLGTTAGTIVQLASGGRTLRILGYYHRPSPALPLRLPPDQAYHLRVSPEELQAILDRLPPPGVDAPVASRLRCELFVHPWSPRRLFEMTAPMGVTVALIFASAIVLELTPLSRYSWGQYVHAAVALPIFVGGMVFTIVRTQRRRPEFELDVGRGEVALRETRSGRVRFAAPAGTIQFVRFMHRVSARGVAFEYPCLGLRAPGQPDLVLGVYDQRYGWTAPAEWLSYLPGYVVSDPDWEALVRRFGLATTARFPAANG
jgi:hypothetical protein